MARLNGHVFVGGKVFLHAKQPGLDTKPEFGDAIYIHEGIIKHVGSENDDEISQARADGATVHQLNGRTVLPGFIDGHIHLLRLGQSLSKAALDHCENLEDVRKAIKDHATANPDEPRILCKGWMRYMSKPLASLIDDLDPRPIYIDSKDLHTTWCSTPALKELDAQNLKDPEGGKIERDSNGNPTGAFDEAAVFNIIWPFLASVATKKDREEWIRAAVQTYNASGYIGAIDMAMEDQAWDILLAIRKEEPERLLPFRLAAYWLMRPSTSESDCLAQVDRAIEVHKQLSAEESPDLHVVGIKVICDGIVDACTAYLSEPYLKGVDATKASTGQPFWDAKILNEVVRKADAAGLQIALHAIGDAAISMAVDALSTCSPLNRHRIEHLELASAKDAKRLGELGITASVQPVHADPWILRAWPSLLGPHRCTRAFPYREFSDGGAALALGSDSPTSPWDIMGNVYVATTRKSYRNTAYDEVVNYNFRLGVCESVVAASYGSARSVFWDDRLGSLEVGKVADLTVWDMQWDRDALLGAKVEETWFGGERVWKRV
ncbi:amidohydrolase 3 [Hypoxylon trugodes]|uniref:amidohydrolase 3 n=1 Tax=Hypoxylon trugodes TaxID=326681 RepID=UPI0021953565|nr:amidohydrolase 3 [Hypoxylon trugodes]KAI1387602.1 amidohydrolase 3 [Hypoxylon trugodes]